MRELRPPIVLGDKVWCPRCKEYVKVVRVAGAAKVVDVDRRTIYNYVKKNKVFSVKVAGSTLRVCTHCYTGYSWLPAIVAVGRCQDRRFGCG